MVASVNAKLAVALTDAGVARGGGHIAGAERYELAADVLGWQARIPSIESSCFSLVASEVEGSPSGFQTAAPRSILHLSRSDEPRTEQL